MVKQLEVVRNNTYLMHVEELNEGYIGTNINLEGSSSATSNGMVEAHGQPDTNDNAYPGDMDSMPIPDTNLNLHLESTNPETKELDTHGLTSGNEKGELHGTNDLTNKIEEMNDLTNESKETDIFENDETTTKTRGVDAGSTEAGTDVHPIRNELPTLSAKPGSDPTLQIPDTKTADYSDDFDSSASSSLSSESTSSTSGVLIINPEGPLTQIEEENTTPGSAAPDLASDVRDEQEIMESEELEISHDRSKGEENISEIEQQSTNPESDVPDLVSDVRDSNQMETADTEVSKNDKKDTNVDFSGTTDTDLKVMCDPQNELAEQIGLDGESHGDEMHRDSKIMDDSRSQHSEKIALEQHGDLHVDHHPDDVATLDDMEGHHFKVDLEKNKERPKQVNGFGHHIGYTENSEEEMENEAYNQVGGYRESLLDSEATTGATSETQTVDADSDLDIMANDLDRYHDDTDPEDDLSGTFTLSVSTNLEIKNNNIKIQQSEPKTPEEVLKFIGIIKPADVMADKITRDIPSNLSVSKPDVWNSILISNDTTIFPIVETQVSEPKGTDGTVNGRMLHNGETSEAVPMSVEDAKRYESKLNATLARTIADVWSTSETSEMGTRNESQKRNNPTKLRLQITNGWNNTTKYEDTNWDGNNQRGKLKANIDKMDEGKHVVNGSKWQSEMEQELEHDIHIVTMETSENNNIVGESKTNDRNKNHVDEYAKLGGSRRNGNLGSENELESFECDFTDFDVFVESIHERDIDWEKPVELNKSKENKLLKFVNNIESGINDSSSEEEYDLQGSKGNRSVSNTCNGHSDELSETPGVRSLDSVDYYITQSGGQDQLGSLVEEVSDRTNKFHRLERPKIKDQEPIKHDQKHTLIRLASVEENVLIGLDLPESELQDEVLVEGPNVNEDDNVISGNDDQFSELIGQTRFIGIRTENTTGLQQSSKGEINGEKQYGTRTELTTFEEDGLLKGNDITTTDQGTNHNQSKSGSQGAIDEQLQTQHKNHTDLTFEEDGLLKGTTSGNDITTDQGTNQNQNESESGSEGAIDGQQQIQHKNYTDPTYHQDVITNEIRKHERGVTTYTDSDLGDNNTTQLCEGNNTESLESYEESESSSSNGSLSGLGLGGTRSQVSAVTDRLNSIEDPQLEVIDSPEQKYGDRHSSEDEYGETVFSSEESCNDSGGGLNSKTDPEASELSYMSSVKVDLQQISVNIDPSAEAGLEVDELETANATTWVNTDDTSSSGGNLDSNEGRLKTDPETLDVDIVQNEVTTECANINDNGEHLDLNEGSFKSDSRTEDADAVENEVTTACADTDNTLNSGKKLNTTETNITDYEEIPLNGHDSNVNDSSNSIPINSTGSNVYVGSNNGVGDLELHIAIKDVNSIGHIRSTSEPKPFPYGSGSGIEYSSEDDNKSELTELQEKYNGEIDEVEPEEINTGVDEKHEIAVDEDRKVNKHGNISTGLNSETDRKLDTHKNVSAKLNYGTVEKRAVAVEEDREFDAHKSTSADLDEEGTEKLQTEETDTKTGETLEEIEEDLPKEKVEDLIEGLSEEKSKALEYEEKDDYCPETGEAKRETHDAIVSYITEIIDNAVKEVINAKTSDEKVEDPLEDTDDKNSNKCEIGLNDTINSAISEVIGQLFDGQFSDSDTNNNDNDSKSYEERELELNNIENNRTERRPNRDLSLGLDLSLNFKDEGELEQIDSFPSDLSEFEGFTPRSDSVRTYDSESITSYDSLFDGSATKFFVPNTIQEHGRTASVLTEGSSVDFSSSSSESGVSEFESQQQLEALVEAEIEDACNKIGQSDTIFNVKDEHVSQADLFSSSASVIENEEFAKRPKLQKSPAVDEGRIEDSNDLSTDDVIDELPITTKDSQRFIISTDHVKDKLPIVTTDTESDITDELLIATVDIISDITDADSQSDDLESHNASFRDELNRNDIKDKLPIVIADTGSGIIAGCSQSDYLDSSSKLYTSQVHIILNIPDREVDIKEQGAADIHVKLEHGPDHDPELVTEHLVEKMDDHEKGNLEGQGRPEGQRKGDELESMETDKSESEMSEVVVPAGPHGGEAPRRTSTPTPCGQHGTNMTANSGSFLFNFCLIKYLNQLTVNVIDWLLTWFFTWWLFIYPCMF